MKNEIIIQNMTRHQVEIQTQEALLRVLENIPVLNDIEVFRSHNNMYDIEAHAKINWQEKLHIVCEVISKAEPQYVRNVARHIIEQDRNFQYKFEKEVYYIIAAPYISPKSSKICEEMGIGYIDLSGNCMFKYKSLYVRVEGKLNKYKDSRGTKSIFERSSVKSSIILRHLFQEPNRIWKTSELANASGASLGQVSKVKKFLEEKELVSRSNSKNGIKINNPREILEQWAQVYNTKPNTVYEYYTIDSIPLIEQKLGEIKNKFGIECALTGFAGGARYAPTVRYNKVHVYVQLQDYDEVINYLGCKKVTSGSNISIIIPHDSSVLFDKRYIQQSLVASPVQVYLDLMGLKGRGEEAAIAILEKEILE